MINFEISLWPNEWQYTLEMLGSGTEFHPPSQPVDEFSVDHVTMLRQSMNHSVTQVGQLQRGAPPNCNA